MDGFASFSSGYDENGPAIFINRERHPVQLPSGKWLNGPNGNDPIKDVRWEDLDNGNANISYTQELRFDRKAVRGLFKIAVESVAFFEGLASARVPELDPVKRFVMVGDGNFRAIMLPDNNPEYESYFTPCVIKDGFAKVCGFTILGIGFLCDFDPEFAGGKILLSEAKSQGLSAQIIPNWPRDLWLKNNPAATT